MSRYTKADDRARLARAQVDAIRSVHERRAAGELEPGSHDDYEAYSAAFTEYIETARVRALIENGVDE